MQVRAIDHVQLAMPAGGEDDARAFYAGLLGIPEVPKPPHLAVRGGCWFESPTVKVHLGVDGDFRPARKAHPALLVADLPALTRRLVEAGVEVVDGEPLDGYDRVYASDPFGNRIELLEPLPRSPQESPQAPAQEPPQESPQEPPHELRREATAGDSARRARRVDRDGARRGRRPGERAPWNAPTNARL